MIFYVQDVFLLCILMIDNNFNSLYYIVSYRTNYMKWGSSSPGYRRRQIYMGNAEMPAEQTHAAANMPAAFFKCRKDVDQ